MSDDEQGPVMTDVFPEPDDSGEPTAPDAFDDTEVAGGDVQATDEVETGEVETGDVETGEVETGEVETDAPADVDLGDAELLDVEPVAAIREPSPFDRPGRWYVVHTYAGYENKVKQNLASRVRSMGVEEQIFEVAIPMETVIEFKGGRKQEVQK